MRIGWVCKGYTHLNVKSVDGMLNIRVPLLNMLLKEHNIIWLGHKRPNRMLHNNIFYFPMVEQYLKAFKQFEKGYTGKTKIKDFITEFEPSAFPKLDILIVEISRIHIYAPIYASIIWHYKNIGNTKIILWDTDRWLNDFKHWLKPFGLSERLREFIILAPYLGNTKYAPYLEPECYNLSYFPYDSSKELPIKTKSGDLCYIGNDYRRRDKMEKYYNFKWADIYGNYKDKEWKDTMSCQFKGRVEPWQVRDIYSKYTFCVQIVKKDYEKFGLMTPRINEVLEAGTLILVDGDILTAEIFVDKEYIINSSKDVELWREKILKMRDIEYKKRVYDQREKVKRFCNYNKLLSVFKPYKGQKLVSNKIEIKQQKRVSDFFK
jgi:hypothetical protein